MNRMVIFACGIGLSALAVGQAYAQEAKETSGKIEDIVVTAQKRAENVQDVPISLTAISPTMLDRMHVTNMTNLQGSVPNLQINTVANNPTAAVFFIRGLGIQDSDPYLLPAVSVVVDGVVHTVNAGALVDLFDIERVEVLRGPQGTLFGANTTGGVINVITKQPTGEFGGHARVSVGNFSRIDVQGAMDFPIIQDRLAGKVVFQHVSRDGYFTDVADGKNLGAIDMTSMRGYLKFTPGENFDATLMSEFTRGRNGAAPVVNTSLPGDALYVAPGYTGYDYRTSVTSVPNQSNLDSRGVNLTMNWDSPIGDIVSISGYRHLKTDIYGDQDATPLFLYDSHRVLKHEQWSQEIRNTLKPSDALEVIMGVYGLYQHYTVDQSLRQEGLKDSHGRRAYTGQWQRNIQLSGFLQSYLDVTDRFSLQAGIRLTYEKTKARTLIASFINPTGGPSVWSGDEQLSSLTVRGSKSWTNVGGKVGANYKFTDDLNGYAYYARGFKSGGFTGRVSLPQDIGPFDPEYVDTFELGIKSDWFDRRLRVNLALFYTKFDGIQLANSYMTTHPTTGLLTSSTTTENAAMAKTKGFELETTLVPIDGLTLTGSLAYLDATYDTFIFGVGANAIDMSGRSLMNSPKWAWNLAANYHFALAGGEMSFYGQYNRTGPKYTNISATARNRVQEVELVNANMEWTSPDERWSIGAWARNLLNKKYISTTLDVPKFMTFTSMGSPREYGVELKYRW